MSIRWARDCYGVEINWIALGQKPPANPMANADAQAEWLRSLRTELRLPALTVQRGGLAKGYGYMFSVPTSFRILDDPRAVTLVAMSLDHYPALGAMLNAGDGRLSAKPGARVFALIGNLSFQSQEKLGGTWLDELEGNRLPFRTVMEPDS